MGGKCQEHKTQQGVGFGLQKARGIIRHQQDLAEDLGSVPGEVFSIWASSVRLPGDPAAQGSPQERWSVLFSRDAACGFPGQGMKAECKKQSYLF